MEGLGSFRFNQKYHNLFFRRWTEVSRVWNDTRVSNSFHFWVNELFKSFFPTLLHTSEMLYRPCFAMYKRNEGLIFIFPGTTLILSIILYMLKMSWYDFPKYKWSMICKENNLNERYRIHTIGDGNIWTLIKSNVTFLLCFPVWEASFCQEARSMKVSRSRAVDWGEGGVWL